MRLNETLHETMRLLPEDSGNSTGTLPEQSHNTTGRKPHYLPVGSDDGEKEKSARHAFIGSMVESRESRGLPAKLVSI